MTRNGEPIETVAVREAVETGISYSQRFAEWEACIAAGLDIERWEAGGYPIALKAAALAWHRGHVQVALHSQDAAAAKARAHGP